MSAAAVAPSPPAPLPSAPPPSYPTAPSSPSVEDDDDLYGRLKSLQRHMEFVKIQEEYVKDEQKNLKHELLRAQEEVKRIQSMPLVIGQFMETVDGNNGIVGSTTGSNYYVRILSTINRELLKPSASVALHRHSNALVDVLPPEADSSISLLASSEKPNVLYSEWVPPPPRSLSLTLPTLDAFGTLNLLTNLGFTLADLCNMDVICFCSQLFAHNNNSSSRVIVS